MLVYHRVHNIQNGMFHAWSVFQNHKHAQASCSPCVVFKSKIAKTDEEMWIEILTNKDKKYGSELALASESPDQWLIPLINT